MISSGSHHDYFLPSHNERKALIYSECTLFQSSNTPKNATWVRRSNLGLPELSIVEITMAASM